MTTPEQTTGSRQGLEQVTSSGSTLGQEQGTLFGVTGEQEQETLSGGTRGQEQGTLSGGTGEQELGTLSGGTCGQEHGTLSRATQGQEQAASSGTTQGPEQAASTRSTPRPRKRNFKKVWLSAYKWLRYDNRKDLMHCQLCREVKSNSTMAKGTNNFRTSTITHHLTFSEHQLLVSAPKEWRHFEKAAAVAETKQEKAVAIAMKAVFWMCSENLPLSKFSSLMELLKLLGVPNIEYLKIGKRIDYTGYNSACGFLKVLSDVIDANLVTKTADSPVITVLTDESTDIVVNHRLTINLRIVSPVELKPSTHFLCDVLLHDAKGSSIFAAIKHELDARGISLQKVYGLGTDGANVMTGSKTGLTGHFLCENLANTHCGAHRVALVSEQAAENIKAIQDFKSTVTSIYYYFYKSPTRVSQMETIQKVLNEPVLKYREVHQVRWLSFCAALEAIYRTLDSLITYFTSRENDAKAVGLKKKTAQALFIHIAYGMMDWLQPIMKLNLFFQEKDVDIARVKVSIKLNIYKYIYL